MKVQVEFRYGVCGPSVVVVIDSGGVELLFSNQRNLTIELPDGSIISALFIILKGKMIPEKQSVMFNQDSLYVNDK